MCKVLVLGGLLMVGTLYASSAIACSCLPPPPPREALAQADAVFIGEVIQVRSSEEAGAAAENHVTLRVQEYWKGAAEAQVVVRTAGNSAACGVSFQEGQRYIVYASLQEGALHTNLCTRTKAVGDAGEDLEALGPAEPVNASRRMCGGPTNQGALQAVFFVLAGLVLVRRRT